MDTELRKEITERIRTIWPNKPTEEILKHFEEVLEYSHLLTVYSLDSDEQANGIDIAILRALLKAKQNNHKAQVKLALTWNRVDIAKNYIFTEDRTWNVIFKFLKITETLSL